MHIIHHKKELTGLLKERKKPGDIVGFVPTMGALHQGHLSLIHQAKREADLVVVSIFVNPTQFDNSSDLEKYPRGLPQDKAFLEEADDDIILFAPQTEEIYGSDPKTETFDFGPVATVMEGASRKGHFDGVGTVLKHLFEIIAPDKAFFGEKDYQQLLIVKRLVELLNLPIEVVGCPIDRQKNGLARSSRNKRLTAEQQEEAAFIYQSLQKARSSFHKSTPQEIRAAIEQDFKDNPHFKLDYFEIANADNLQKVVAFDSNKKYRAFIAAGIGEVRLIDNIALN